MSSWNTHARPPAAPGRAHPEPAARSSPRREGRVRLLRTSVGRVGQRRGGSLQLTAAGFYPPEGIRGFHGGREAGSSCGAMSDQLGCTQCRESLCGRRYIRAEDGPHCVSCYERRFANTCRECEELIGHDAEELFFQDGYYHAACLRCSHCRRSLAQQPFSSRGGALVCGDCCGSHFSSRCSACRGAATPGSRMLEYGGSTWHEGCFTCQACGEPMGTEAFVPHQDSFYCLPCYQRRLAPQCRHCKKALTKGGVAYREEVWHKECFLCGGCSSPLAGQPFTSQGDTPYCIRCFSSLYAKKCAGCNTAITGFGDGKYVSFEERQWHQPCFKCWRCSVSLVGSAFFPDRGHILCSDCNSED